MKAATDLQEQAIEEVSKEIEDLLSHSVNGEEQEKQSRLHSLMVCITGQWMMLFVSYQVFSYYIPLF